jgi:hypothetical protein
MSVEERTLVRALASQSGRAPGVYPGHRLYLLTGLLTRLIGTEKTERDAEDGHRAIPQVSETPETQKTHVVWLITQRRPATPRCASMRPRRRAITARESADGALREACSLAPIA